MYPIATQSPEANQVCKRFSAMLVSFVMALQQMPRGQGQTITSHSLTESCNTQHTVYVYDVT